MATVDRSHNFAGWGRRCFGPYSGAGPFPQMKLIDVEPWKVVVTAMIAGAAVTLALFFTLMWLHGG